MVGRGRACSSVGASGSGTSAPGSRRPRSSRFAFLPVAYSRIAVTDVGTLAPVALALCVLARGRSSAAGCSTSRWRAPPRAWRSASSTRPGLVLLPVLMPAALRAARRRARAPREGRRQRRWRPRRRRVLRHHALLLHRLRRRARHQIAAQADTAGDFAKLGQEQDNGFLYYLDSLSWGLGWAAAVGALAGLVLVFAPRPPAGRAAGALPARAVRLPGAAVALLRALAAARLPRARAARGLRARPRERARAALALGRALCGLLGARAGAAVAADVRTMRLLGKEDTRELARDYLVDRLPPASRVVIEPAVPAR